ncbi:HNT2 [Candida jiufengensis]|uniref:HNT2 n=1 Tax=Candida jiufengensis TaxID=497108 RepID=UPI00222475DF|nr:HNT2 [Candida jiufengensis]KAI5952623.1 HNT2 [Candida jiufengensis]
MPGKDIYFFKFIVNNQVFYKSKFSYALVNLKPLVPGHVLVVPLRTSVLRFADLTPDESIDYMNTLQLVHKFISKIYKADSLNIAIQDGPESGQSIPHLHTHIIPRYKTDGFGDSIYNKLEVDDLDAHYKQFEERKSKFINITENSKSELDQNDDARKNRTNEEMEKEAKHLNEEIEKFIIDSKL